MKKIVTLFLAAAVGVGMCGAFTACDSENDRSSNREENLSKEEVLYFELLDGVRQEETECVTLDTHLTLDLAGTASSIDMQASFGMEENGMQGDLFGRMKTADSDTYLVEFFRNNVVYSGLDSWPAAAKGYDDIVGSYRTANGPVLSVAPADELFGGLGELGGTVSTVGALSSVGGPPSTEAFPFPIATKIMGNLPLLLGAKIEEKSEGYVIKFDLIEGCNDVLDGVRGVLEQVNGDSTLGALIGKGYIDDALFTLFHGVKASEFFAAMNFTSVSLPDYLPEAGEKDLYGYIHDVLSSKDVYDAMREASLGVLPEGKTLGSLTLREIGEVNGWSEEEMSLSIEKIKTYVANLKKNLIGGILALATNGSASGKLDGAEISLTFDKSKQLTGVHIEVDGLEMAAALPMADMPQAMSVQAEGTIDVVFPAQVTLTTLSGMRYLSDESQKGVLEKGAWGPTEQGSWPLELGKPYGSLLVIDSPYEIEAVVGDDGVTFCLNTADGQAFSHTIPMADIKVQLAYPDNIISEDFYGGAYGDLRFTIRMWFQFTEEADGYTLTTQYQTLANNATGSNGYGFMPEIFLPFARVIKTIA